MHMVTSFPYVTISLVFVKTVISLCLFHFFVIVNFSAWFVFGVFTFFFFFSTFAFVICCFTSRPAPGSMHCTIYNCTFLPAQVLREILYAPGIAFLELERNRLLVAEIRYAEIDLCPYFLKWLCVVFQLLHSSGFLRIRGLFILRYVNARIIITIINTSTVLL